MIYGGIYYYFKQILIDIYMYYYYINSTFY